MYSEKILDHFLYPRNLGYIPDHDGQGRMGDPTCGDYLHIYIKVANNSIEDIKFEIMGCPAAIATSSALTELAKGKTLDEAIKITDHDVIRALGGLPDPKVHCSNLGAGALHLAIEDYLEKTKNKR
ncbi:MAG TPA: iron-sulfur cluster assembly scaffold protein [Firmicutes bacterium]|jgi:nitrogen fixation NifU-like protein|nr:iron-sulfur cluster assembly scaffold protein [Bacillota bacterium]